MNQSNRSRAILSESTYKTTKGMVYVGIPTVSSLYFGLSQIWDLPSTEGVLGILAILALLLGVALRTSENNYRNSPSAHDGEMVLIVDGGGVRTFSLEVSGDPDDLTYKDVISFKVRKTAVPEPPLN
jgi:Putative phage holin Dp-1